MAPPPGTLRVGRYFLALFALMLLLYLLVFLPGERHTPKLGLDLVGGQQVIFQAKAPHGKTPSTSAMEQAKQIIEDRVNGTGVTEATVVIQGDDQLVVSIPGGTRTDVTKLGAAAVLNFRGLVAPAQAVDLRQVRAQGRAHPGRHADGQRVGLGHHRLVGREVEPERQPDGQGFGLAVAQRRRPPPPRRAHQREVQRRHRGRDDPGGDDPGGDESAGGELGRRPAAPAASTPDRAQQVPGRPVGRDAEGRQGAQDPAQRHRVRRAEHPAAAGDRRRRWPTSTAPPARTSRTSGTSTSWPAARSPAARRSTPTCSAR